MAEKPRVVVAGGTGVFGRLFARELAQSGAFRIVVAARDGAAASRLATELGCESLALDLGDRSAVAATASDSFAFVCLAGPFQRLDPSIAAVVVSAGGHWLDISDDEQWVDNLLTNPSLHADAVARSVVVVPGLSSVPALSGVLARLALRDLPAAVRAEITLFIGNRNLKGTGAIASAICAPSTSERLTIDLPFGRREALRFASPDETLLCRELGIAASFHVAFELPAAKLMVRVMRALPLSARIKTAIAALVSRTSAPFSRFGSDVGGVDVRLVHSDGRAIRRRVTASGQRLAIVPALTALHALKNGEITSRGCISPAEALPLERWLSLLAGHRLVVE